MHGKSSSVTELCTGHKAFRMDGWGIAACTGEFMLK